MVAPRPRSQWLRPAVPKAEREKILWALSLPKRGEISVFRALAPLLVFGEVEDGMEEVRWIYVTMLDYFRRHRRREARPFPSEADLAKWFGADGDIVTAMWPIIRFIDAIESKRRVSPQSDADMREISALLNEARVLLLCFSLWQEDTDRESRLLTAHAIRRIARARQFRLEEAIAVTEEQVLAADTAILGYKPEGNARSPLKYFVAVARNKAADHLRCGDIAPSTLRNWKAAKKLAPDGNADDIDRIWNENLARRRHDPIAGRNTKAAAALLGIEESSYRALRKRLIAAGDLPEPKRDAGAVVATDAEMKVMRPHVAALPRRKRKSTRKRA